MIIWSLIRLSIFFLSSTLYVVIVQLIEAHFFPPLSFFQGPHLPLMMASLSDQIKKIQVTTTYQTFVKEYMALLWSLIIISILLNVLP